MTPRPLTPHYSGPRSLTFWSRVQQVTPDVEHWRLYGMACRLQETEERFLKRLRAAEQNARKR